MNKLILILITATSFSMIGIQGNKNASVTVTISEFRNTEGHLLISLYKDKSSFNNGAEEAFRNQKINVTGERMQVKFDNIPSGEYAILFLHDENGNEDMDTNMFGIPQEGYGASNNAVNTFSAPKYEDAKFTISGENYQTELTIYY